MRSVTQWHKSLPPMKGGVQLVSRSNGNGFGDVRANSDSALRSRVFAALSGNNVSNEQALKVLAQCAAQIRDRQLVEDFAAGCKMQLSGFRTTDVLELYFDVAQGPDAIGYISKGWDDPGFRIGELIQIPKPRAPKFKAKVAQIRRLCATNGLGLTIGKADGALQLQMDGVIYDAGFNKKTFKKTFGTLRECVQKVREMTG